MGQEYQRHFEDFRSNNGPEKGGIVKISGSFLLDHENDVMSLVRAEGLRASSENPEHKIIKTEKNGDEIIVSTSEHSLAMHIGKALLHAYKGEHTYRFRSGEKFVEVDWKRD